MGHPVIIINMAFVFLRQMAFVNPWKKIPQILYSISLYGVSHLNSCVLTDTSCDEGIAQLLQVAFSLASKLFGTVSAIDYPISMRFQEEYTANPMPNTSFDWSIAYTLEVVIHVIIPHELDLSGGT